MMSLSRRLRLLCADGRVVELELEAGIIVTWKDVAQQVCMLAECLIPICTAPCRCVPRHDGQ